MPDTQLTDLESVDFTRRVARLLLTHTPAEALAVDDADLAARLERAADIVRTLVAAEQVGGAARCLEELVAYLTGRIQFDRPIASFQSVKHDCANLLADVTSARAAVEEAGRRLAARDPGAGHYAALAKTTAGLAYLAVSDRSIQLHGGIGFTWECDAHLYYRRAIYTQSIFGDPAAMRRRLADDLDLSGRDSGRTHHAWAAARHPEAGTTADTSAVTSDYDTVRAEATQWLRDNWDPAMPTREWWRRLAEAGWSLPQWPVEWSGRDLPGPLLPAVHDAFAEVGALWPPWSPGQHLAGPTVIHHGTQEQKQLLLPALATGEHFWAQLFSEPDAGSDLASLRTRAVKQTRRRLDRQRSKGVDDRSDQGRARLPARADRSRGPEAPRAVLLRHRHGHARSRGPSDPPDQRQQRILRGLPHRRLHPAGSTHRRRERRLGGFADLARL